MIRLAMLFYSILWTGLSGTGVVIALVAGYGTLFPILLAAVAGALLAIPFAYLLARKLYGTPVRA